LQAKLESVYNNNNNNNSQIFPAYTGCGEILMYNSWDILQDKKACKLYDLASHRVFVSRDVKFKEHIMLFKSESQSESTIVKIIPIIDPAPQLQDIDEDSPLSLPIINETTPKNVPEVNAYDHDSQLR